jgi:cytochrome b involved in lipid metabolism
MDKQTIVGLCIGILFAGGLIWNAQYKESVMNEALQQDIQEAMEQTVPAGSGIDDGPAGAGKVAGYTLSDIALHNDEESCWAAVGTNVYDLTEWIAKHPGGPQKILNMCGTDATAVFEGQHGGQLRPEATLETSKIGVLQEG